MYDELVKRLRTATTLPVMNALCQEAADAIEELQKALDAVNDAHNEGYDVGYWAGRRDYEPKWIPVTERLPKEMETVLVTDGKNVSWSFCVNDYGTMEFYSAWKITHWMPLPEPPKEEQ